MTTVPAFKVDVGSNQALIQVLRNAWQRELDRIERAEQEIIKIKLDLLVRHLQNDVLRMVNRPDLLRLRRDTEAEGGEDAKRIV